MSNDLEIHDNEDRDAYIRNLERRVRYCENVASQYEMMFKQIQAEMKALADRQGNIQQVYDYMTRVGSAIAIKEPHDVKRLNPITKSLPMSETKRLELMSKFKFKVGDRAFYADEQNNRVTAHNIAGIDIIDKHPRYSIDNIFGYVDESKLFKTDDEAQSQLDEWKRNSCVRY